jgi:hypothetical protein
VFDAFDVDWLVPEFALNIGKEVDVMNEGTNCERAAANFKGSRDGAFPKNILELDNRKVKGWGGGWVDVACLVMLVFFKMCLLFVAGFQQCPGKGRKPSR